MAEFWEITHARAQQTIAVWNAHNPGFTVGPLDLATHQANADTLFTQSGDSEVVKDAYDEAVDARDASVELIHTLNTRVPQLIRSNLLDGDLLQNEVKDVLKVKLGSFGKELKRARRLKSLWTRVNDQRAAATPPLPAIDRSGKTVADLDAAITSHPTLLQDVEDKLADWNQSKSVLEQTDRLVDDGNKDWYEAWKNYYDEGTPEHDALSQITTENGGSGGGGLGAPENLQLSEGAASDVSATWDPVTGADVYLVEQLEVGVDSDFTLVDTIGVTSLAFGSYSSGATVQVRVRARDAENNEGPNSTVEEITFT